VSGTVFSKVIDGVTVTVDVEATRAAYELCEVGLECKCGACRLLIQQIDDLLTSDQINLLQKLGVDFRKPYASSSTSEGRRLLHMDVSYEVKGRLNPDRAVLVENDVYIGSLGPSPRMPFGSEGTTQLEVMISQERLPTEEIPELENR
jgi:hypothetical protein